MPSPHICTLTHTGDISRNQWCVPSCLLHTPDFTAQKQREKTHHLWSPKQSSLNVTITEWGAQISKLSPTDSLWMQNTIVSRGQGSPVGGSHFLPWPFSFGIEDHVTQMLAHNTSLALKLAGDPGSVLIIDYYGAETKNKNKPKKTLDLWPAPSWRSRGEKPNESKSGCPPLLSDSIWNRMVKIKDISPLLIQNSLFSFPNTRIDFFHMIFLHPQS